MCPNVIPVTSWCQICIKCFQSHVRLLREATSRNNLTVQDNYYQPCSGTHWINTLICHLYIPDILLISSRVSLQIISGSFKKYSAALSGGFSLQDYTLILHFSLYSKCNGLITYIEGVKNIQRKEIQNLLDALQK